MIDIDDIEDRLDSALTHRAVRPPRSPVPAPIPAPAPASASASRPRSAPPPRRRQQPVAPSAPAPAPRAQPTAQAAPAGATANAPELLELGLLDQADALMAGHSHPRDALTWTTMRAALDGRQDAVRTGVEELRRLAERTDDAEAWSSYWLQRFWAAFEWGTEDERLEVLDHCRTRAYRFDDLLWWGNLTLLLAAMGKQDESVRAFDAVAPMADAGGLDLVTNLIEAAALLGDAGRAAIAFRSLHAPEGRLVVVGPGVVCKGSVDRYRALGHAALGRWADAGECFRRAEATHRSMGAGPLLARTLQQASATVVAA